MTDADTQDLRETGREVAVQPEGRMQERARDIAIGKHGINFTNAAEVMDYARMMAASGFAVRKEFRNNAGACLALVDDAIRFGMSAYFLARRAYLVNDMLAYESSVFAAVIIQRGPLAKLPAYSYEGEGPDRVCTVTLYLKPGVAENDVIVHQSPPRGEIKPQNSPLWKSDPDQQQGYYTIRAAARRHFPHVLGGAVDLEEAQSAREMVDVTPKPSVVTRLAAGATAAATNGDVEREINGGKGDADADDRDAGGGDSGPADGDAGAQADADPAKPATDDQAADAGEAEAAPLTSDEKALIADIQKATDEASTETELDVVLWQYGDALGSSRPLVFDSVRLIAEARRKKVAKKPPKAKRGEAANLL